jgi:hypothetical protein
MSISEIFNISFLCCLGISLLLIGLISIYFNNKLLEQEHKLSAMFGIVTTMADQMHILRTTRNTNANTNANNVDINHDIKTINPFTIGGSSNTNELINVSDEEDESDDERDESDDDDDGEDGESDESDDEGDDSEDEDSVENIHEEIPNDKLKEFIKIINMGETYNINEIDVEEVPNLTDSIKSLDINELSEHDNVEVNETDYKKMSLGKLRIVVVEKGLAQDASKMKKNDILKLFNV